MRSTRNTKTSGRYRKQQSCPKYLRSTWPTVYTENADMATFLAVMRAKMAPLSYSTEHINSFQSRSSRTSSTPVLKSFGDTDTEDEGFPRRERLASSSSQGSYNIQHQATSMGSLTSSYSSLGERSASTLSPLDDVVYKGSLSTSLKAILDPEFCDYDRDPKMRETVEDIVSPKAIRTNKMDILGLSAVDPSILVVLAGTNTPEDSTKYSPTTLCDLSVILAENNTTIDAEDSRSRDLAQLRFGTHPVADKDESSRRGWDIPEEKEEEEELVAKTQIPYRRLSETSDSGDECCPVAGHDLSLLCSSLSTESRSRSSSLSSAHDSSDYLGDISGEETVSRHVLTWPSSKKLKINLETDGSPFALSPRIPGVDYYGVPTSNIADSPGRVSRGLDAFFNSRSIVHRLGPHGLEQVYEMIPCPERCGFAYPVPPQPEVI